MDTNSKNYSLIQQSIEAQMLISNSMEGQKIKEETNIIIKYFAKANFESITPIYDWIK